VTAVRHAAAPAMSQVSVGGGVSGHMAGDDKIKGPEDTVSRVIFCVIRKANSVMPARRLTEQRSAG